MRSSTQSLVIALCMWCSAAGCSQKDPDAADGGAGTSAVQDGGSAGSSGSAGGGTDDASTNDDGAMPDGDSGTGDIDSGTPTKADYFPLVDKSEFVFRHTSGSGTRDETNTISATKYKTKDAFLSTASPDTKNEVTINVFMKIGSKIHRMHKDVTINDVSQGTVDYEPGFLRYDSAWLDQKIGAKNVENYRRVELNASGMIIDDDMRTHTFAIESLSETVTVPAGKLNDCIRISRKRMLAAGASPGDDDDKTLWFCPGIGKTKELTVSTGATEELVSCKIPGRACP